MNSFFELLKTRRSIRKYKPLAVEPEKIQEITTAALMSQLRNEVIRGNLLLFRTRKHSSNYPKAGNMVHNF